MSASLSLFERWTSLRRAPGMRGSARIARAIATRWRCSAGQLDPSFADDRVVLLVEALDELVGVGDPTDRGESDPRSASGLARNANVVRPRFRRTGSCPAAQRRSAGGRRAGGTVVMSRPSTRIRPLPGRVERHHQADPACSFRSPLDPTSAVVVPAGAVKPDAPSARGRLGLYSKLTFSKTTSPSIVPSGGLRLSSSSSVAIDDQLAGCDRGRRTLR